MKLVVDGCGPIWSKLVERRYESGHDALGTSPDERPRRLRRRYLRSRPIRVSYVVASTLVDGGDRWPRGRE